MKKRQQHTGGPPSRTGTPRVPEHLLQFMNSLPLSMEPVEWITEFKEALRVLLPDVDRVGVTVNTSCNLFDPGKGIAFEVSHSINADRPNRIDVGVHAYDLSDKGSERALKGFVKAGYPLDQYQPPHGFDYHINGSVVPLGSILLFRARGASAISSQTLETVEALRDFICYALSDLVTRVAYANPVERQFNRVILEMGNQLKFTPREYKILTLRLMGMPPPEVARWFYLSPNTVKKYMKKIFQKAGGHSSIGIFTQWVMSESKNQEIMERNEKSCYQEGQMFLW